MLKLLKVAIWFLKSTVEQFVPIRRFVHYFPVRITLYLIFFLYGCNNYFCAFIKVGLYRTRPRFAALV